MSILPMQTSMHRPQPVQVTRPYRSRVYSNLHRSLFSSLCGSAGLELPPPPVRAYPIERHAVSYTHLTLPTN